jgi:hypothetical protein
VVTNAYLRKMLIRRAALLAFAVKCIVVGGILLR